MLDWRQLVWLSDAELSRLDVAAVNLACAVGLPGAPSEGQAIECIDRLDHYARSVQHYTGRRMPEFEQHPEVYENSESTFSVVCMVTLLQKQFGVRYHPNKKVDDASLDTADVFVHGALIGKGGTCASLPVVYAAVGRRLGYPLKLVQTRSHLFCRWDDGGSVRFNIEVNDTGINTPPDDYYRSGRYEFSPDLEKQTIFLKSQTSREELAGFLAQRGHRFLELHKHREAAESFIWACSLAPAHKLHESCTVAVINYWREHLRRKTPPRFPRLQVNMPPVRRFPAIPLAVEADVIGFETWENLLDDPDFEERVLKPLRANPDPATLANIPRSMVVTLMQ